MTGRPGGSAPAGGGPGEADGVEHEPEVAVAVATASLLTALYALCHRVGLTAEDVAEIRRWGGCLTPEVWRETKRLLRDADQGADGTRLELGFTALLVRWLGYGDEGAFASAYGVGVAEALARDRGQLSAIARIAEVSGGDEAPELRYAVGGAWASRAAHLMDGLPESAPGAVEAVERALAVFEWPPRNRRILLSTMVAASEACGDEARAESIRHMLEEVAPEDAASDRTSMYRVAATLLTVLWCVVHDDGLLAAERGLDPGIQRSPEAWARARSALDAGRLGDVPIPARTFEAWGVGVALDEGQLRCSLEESVRVYSDLPRMVELLWRRTEPAEDVSREVAWYAVDAAFRRRVEVEAGYHPLPGERLNVYFEVHQGARREQALERVAVLHRLHAVLCRCGDVDPMAILSVHLDLAVEREARGEHEAARRQLAAAVECAQGVEDDPARRDYPEVCLATWHWRSGEVGAARRRVERLEGPKAVEALQLIDARAPEREALREAEGMRMRCGDVHSACAVVFAHLRAGHDLAAERHARELCDANPDSPDAWAALAGVLRDRGRYRDALEPARAAVAAGYEEPAASGLLARVLRGLGCEGREESRALARRALEAHLAGGGLEDAERAELERVAAETDGDVGR